MEENEPRRLCRAGISGPSPWRSRPGTKGKRVYDYVAQGIFRSDDGGEHWTRATDDPRMIGGGQFHDIIVDPRDANILFATQTSLYRSTDAGKTWESYTGAPSGADFNYVWIDPTNDKYMILAVDQGTEISMDAGRTWTTWFNQPTGQMYNVTTDHGFPFFMYSAQQDSGTIATPIFGRGGQITYRDWYTTNGFETGAHHSRSGRFELSVCDGLVRVDSADQQNHRADAAHFREDGRSIARAARRRWDFRRSIRRRFIWRRNICWRRTIRGCTGRR